MSKKYPNMNDSSDEPELKRRRSLNPFENMFRRDGKGVEKDEVKVLDKPGIANFFKLFRRKLNIIFSCNILLIFGNFPIFFAIAAYAYTATDILSPVSSMYSVLRGSAFFDSSPLVMTLMGVYGRQGTVLSFSTLSWIFFGISLLTLFTFGPVHVGTTYILRNTLRGEPVFVWSDFWYAVKKNLKQGIIFGVIDAAMIAMLAFDILSYRMNAASSGMFMALYAAAYCMIIIYSFVRMYAYLMIVTFDMGLFKIIESSIYFSVLGIKRNALALLGTAAVVALDLLLVRVFLPLGLILPFIIAFGLIEFMGVYAAFPKIKEVMIDPYYKEVSAETGSGNGE